MNYLFTLSKTTRKSLLWLFTIGLISYSSQLKAQDIACNPFLNIYLDGDCETTLQPDQLLEGTYDNMNDFQIMILAYHAPDAPVVDAGPNPVIDGTDVGETLTYKIVSPDGINSCWGRITIYDGVIPDLDCTNVSISCVDDSSPGSVGVPLPIPVTAVATPISANTYSLGGFDPCGIATLSYTDVTTGDLCDGDRQITRSWTVTDGSNNTTGCTQIISITPTTIADISDHLPATMILECGDDVPPVATDIGCSNITLTLTNTNTIDYCGNTYDLIRTYVVSDWCANQTISHIQIIKFKDTEDPVLTCPGDMVVGTSSNSCGANVILPPPTSTDCGGGVTYVPTVSAGDVSYNSTMGWVVSNLPTGTHTVTYTGTDACGNSGNCTFDITVNDNSAPIAVCDLHTVVSIGSNGEAYVPASVFDDGSTDNCGPITFEARRMNNAVCSGDDATAFSSFVPFYCCDVGTTVMVVFKVSDGINSNTCMVEVEVQDAIAPTLTCPDDKVVTCVDNVDPSFTGYATATGSCTDPIPTYQDVSNVDCGSGYITRTWSIGNISCDQIITVVNNDPFYISSNPDDTNDDVVWPIDYTTNVCGVSLEPEDLATPYSEPVLYEGACNSISMTHKDTELDFGGGDACFKILRKWIIIDWCQVEDETLNGSNPDPTDPATIGVWHYVQIIKVMNSDDPEILTFDIDLAPESDFGTNSDGAFLVGNFEESCGGVFIGFNITVDDDCTDNEDLDVSWEFNNGSIVTFSGTGLVASTVFNNGTYMVTFTVSDHCGNEYSESRTFVVKDKKKPTPVCFFGLSSPIMPTSGSLTMWASDFANPSSYDNCTDYDGLEFAFSPNIGDDNITITCSDIASDGLVPVTVYVIDSYGNYDFCTTFINITDPNGACAFPSTTFIQGEIQNENQEAIEDVTVTLSDDVGMSLPIVTGVDGAFEFDGMTYGAYDVTPAKDLNFLNGVTTYDLVLINKHILGIEIFDSPYKWIAADANRSGNLTTLDIVKLRAVILHIEDGVAQNTSWRFVDKNYTFSNLNDPLADDFPEHAALDGLSEVPVDFVAIKVGDVNSTSSPNSLLGTDTRTFDGKLAIQLDVKEVAKGEPFEVDFKAKDFKNIEGYQFTLGFDNSKIEFVDIDTKLEGLMASNFGLTKIDEGVITTSWNTNKGISVDDNGVLFTLTFHANVAVNTDELFTINSRYTTSEAYGNNDILDVVLEYNGNEVANGFELYQNTPNPFRVNTNINFNLPQAEEITLKIFDVSGRILKLIKVDAAKGFNSIPIDRKDITSTGVLYYQLETSTITATKKMILVD